MWPPPTVSSRRMVRLADPDLEPARRWRRGSVPAGGPGSPSQLPIGAGLAASPEPTFRQSFTGSTEVDLDEVEQAVEVEVGQRGAAARARSRRCRRRRRASVNVPSAGPRNRLLGSFAA